MSTTDAPKWIADVLDKLPGAVGPLERETLALEIAESFPVLECVRAATESLMAQFKRNGITIADSEARAIAGNALTAIAGAVAAPNTEATEYMREHIEAASILGNAGIPWGDTLPVRVRALVAARPLVRDVGPDKIERLRAAHRAFWAAYQDGNIGDVHHSEEDDAPHAFEPYSVDHLAGTCRVCARGIGEHPCTTERECPEDDTCECQGRAALIELQHAIDDIAGRITP